MTFGSGTGGNVTATASDFVRISGGQGHELLLARGANPIPAFSPSSLLSQSVSSGNAGDIIVNAKQITIENGGRIAASGLASGASGNIVIKASDFVNISGSSPLNESLNPSIISSSVNVVDPYLNFIYNIRQRPTGFSGNVTINTERLSLKDGAQISVRNDGPRNAGIIQINANSINLNNQGGITASTTSGEDGNIILNTQNLQLRHSSLFTAAAQGSGNGGNISINTGTLAILENSNISANATQRQGGNIRINAQGVFRSPDSPITASGGTPELNGTVQVNALVNNSTLGIVPLPIVPVDAAKLIAQGCGAIAGSRGNKFVVTGSGGLS